MLRVRGLAVRKAEVLANLCEGLVEVRFGVFEAGAGMAAFRVIVLLAGPELSELLRVGRQYLDRIADGLAGHFSQVDLFGPPPPNGPILVLVILLPLSGPDYFFPEHIPEIVVEGKVEGKVLLMEYLGQHEH